MSEIGNGKRMGTAAVRAGMSRNTAAKYVGSGKLPSELKEPRSWRTREDPFEKDWPQVVKRLEEAPELEAKALFEDLLEQYPDRYDPGQVRTFQRRVKNWRALSGPDKEIFFPQQHRPGEAMQTDFTWTNELKITIQGEAFPHLLCHPVLPYSNWEWATVCHSESIAALKRGIQEAVFRLGRVPRFHQTDNSSAATHHLGNGQRSFNKDYEDFIAHLGMLPRTIALGCKNQNGDNEALNGALKRRLEQHLLLRGSRDFDSAQSYEAWLWQVVEKANRFRHARLEEELAVMNNLLVRRVAEFKEVEVKVSTWSTISVARNVYSVPSRLIGEKVRVRVYEERIELYYAGKFYLKFARRLGKGGHVIDYRHVIWSLVRKPGAFRLYKYREDMFPSLIFRRAYDRLCERHRGERADLEYLKILHLAASTMESLVAQALSQSLAEGNLKDAEQIKERIISFEQRRARSMPAPKVELASYDELLQGAEDLR